MAIRGCFRCHHRDITLISEEDLQKLGPVNLVIANGHARNTHMLEQVEFQRVSGLVTFRTSSGSCSGGLSTNPSL